MKQGLKGDQREREDSTPNIVFLSILLGLNKFWLYSGVLSMGVPGVPWYPQILAYQRGLDLCNEKLLFILQIPGQAKTTITRRLLCSILQNQGKTAILLVLPPMAPLH